MEWISEHTRCQLQIAGVMKDALGEHIVLLLLVGHPRQLGSRRWLLPPHRATFCLRSPFSSLGALGLEEEGFAKP